VRQRCADHFAACERLDALLAEQWASLFVERPDRTAFLVAATFARSLKTFRALLVLAADGWGEQAAMLDRSLFEDMVVGYWADLKREEAVELLLEHQALTADVHRDVLLKYGFTEEAADMAPLEPERRAELEKKFGRYGERTWYGTHLYAMLDEIEHHWPAGKERQRLRRMYALGYRFNTLMLHHSPHALNETARYSRPEEDTFVLQVGRDIANVPGALLGGFYAVSHLALLGANAEHRQALVDLIERELPRLDPRPRARPPDASSPGS
jgi:hypothetical protein